MTTQKRIERKAVSLFAEFKNWSMCGFAKEQFYKLSFEDQLAWCRLAKKVVRLENRVRIMRVKEFKK